MYTGKERILSAFAHERADRLPVFEADGRVAAVWGLGADRAFLPIPGAQALEITVETIE